MTEKELCRAIGTLCNVYELTDMTYKQYLRHIKDIETEYYKFLNKETVDKPI